MTSIGRYQLTEELGHGGMAVVWAGEALGDHGFRKPVVVKRIHPHLTRQRHIVEMLISEAKLTVRLDHPNIVQVLELGHTGDDYFIVLERVHGCDLAELVVRAAEAGVSLPAALVTHVVREILAGLAYAHQVHDEAGNPLHVVHRDISPSNVLIGRDGRVKLTDFGIARSQLPDRETHAGLKGKLAYMSPEQARGDPVDHRSDLYSTGLVLVELLTGVRPLDGASELEVLNAARRGAWPLVERLLGDRLVDHAAVLRRALAATAAERFADARSMREALAPLSIDPEAGVERLAELLALIGCGGDVSGADPRTTATPPPVAPGQPARTLVTRSTRALPAPGAGSAALVTRGASTVAWLPVIGLVVAALCLAVVMAWWGGVPTGSRGQTDAAIEDVAAQPALAPGDRGGEQAVDIEDETPGATGPADAGNARTTVSRPTANTATAPPAATGQELGALSVIVVDGTGEVEVDTPGWTPRHAPLARQPLPAGHWTVHVVNLEAGLDWTGTVEIPGGGHEGIRLVRDDGGHWRRE